MKQKYIKLIDIKSLGIVPYIENAELVTIKTEILEEVKFQIHEDILRYFIIMDRTDII
jgi:hypothetical protein